MKNHDGSDIHQYIKDMSEGIIEEIFKILDTEFRDKGDYIGTQIEMTVLGSMVSTMLYNHLQTHSKKQTDKENHDNYKAYKEMLETAISTGFENAMGMYSEQEVDFVTQILPVHKPVNNLAC